MKHTAQIRWLKLVVTAISLMGLQSAQADELFVDASASENDAGDDWDVPYRSLWDALGDAVSGDTIFVAGGVYFVTDCEECDPALPVDRREATFDVSAGVIIRGGYRGCDDPNDPFTPGCEDANVRDEVSELNGLIDDSPLTKVFHVVTIEGLTSGQSCTVDRFLITNGDAQDDSTALSCTGIQSPSGCGGGMLCRDNAGAVTIRNVTFSGNTARFGGGLMCHASSPIIAGCKFVGNQVFADPGGGNGGGLYMYCGSSPYVYNCGFDGNHADHIGGGMGIQGGCEPTILNCVFRGNTACDFGGGIRSGFDCGPWIINSTFFENESESGGGFASGIDTDADCPDPLNVDCVEPRSVVLRGCIFWENVRLQSNCTTVSSATPGSQIAVDAPSGSPETDPHPLYIYDSDVQFGEDDVFVKAAYAGALHWETGNFELDPEFVNDSDADGADGELGTADDGLRLTYQSPCLNNSDPSQLLDDDADIDENQ
jgi:predicted outer membrane repeat protein